MPIQQDYSPNLDRKEVRDFIRNVGGPTTWDAGKPSRPHFVASGAPDKTVGQVSDLRLFWADREWYEVIEGPGQGQVVGRFNVVVPKAQPLTMHVRSALLIEKGVPAATKQKIEAAFNAYQYPAGGDPQDYAGSVLAGDNTIKRNMFSVDSTFSLEKSGALEVSDRLKQLILGIYAGRSGHGTVTTGPHGPDEDLGEAGQYFKKRSLRLNLVKTEVLDQVPEPKHDPSHEVFQNAGAKTPDSIIDEIVKSETPTECNAVFKLQQWKIMTLLVYPEFKVVWRDHSYSIGCGQIVLRLPSLQIRESDLNLYAYYRYLEKWDNIKPVFEGCLWRAALAGAVIGVVIGDFIDALNAFQAIFTECLKEKLLQMIACMVPGLALIGEIHPGHDWHDV